MQEGQTPNRTFDVCIDQHCTKTEKKTLFTLDYIIRIEIGI